MEEFYRSKKTGLQNDKQKRKQMKGHNMKRSRLQIIRGLPGAGKTTLAIKIYPDIFKIEADMFFTRGGKYTFIPELFKESNEWFFKTLTLAFKYNIDIVLTGVFPGHSTSRLPAVISMARDEDYDIYIHTLMSNYGNVHDVPAKQIDSMRNAFVPEEVLKSVYSNIKHVHFGLMPKTVPNK